MKICDCFWFFNYIFFMILGVFEDLFKEMGVRLIVIDRFGYGLSILNF